MHTGTARNLEQNDIKTISFNRPQLVVFTATAAFVTDVT